MQATQAELPACRIGKGERAECLATACNNFRLRSRIEASQVALTSAQLWRQRFNFSALTEDSQTSPELIVAEMCPLRAACTLVANLDLPPQKPTVPPWSRIKRALPSCDVRCEVLLPLGPGGVRNLVCFGRAGQEPARPGRCRNSKHGF